MKIWYGANASKAATRGKKLIRVGVVGHGEGL